MIPEEKMSVQELRDWCKKHGLSIKGKKAELVAKVVDYKKKLIEKSESESEEEQVVLELPPVNVANVLALLRKKPKQHLNSKERKKNLL